jgi:hypothetical protein
LPVSNPRCAASVGSVGYCILDFSRMCETLQIKHVLSASYCWWAGLARCWETLRRSVLLNACHCSMLHSDARADSVPSQDLSRYASLPGCPAVVSTPGSRC